MQSYSNYYYYSSLPHPLPSVGRDSCDWDSCGSWGSGRRVRA